jgi:hypothetical protein
MIEAVGQILSVHEALSSSIQNETSSVGSLERATESQATEFSRAAGNAPIREVDAAPAPPASGTAAGVVHQLENVFSHLQVFKAHDGRLETNGLPERQPVREGSAAASIDDAIAQMRQAYTHAIMMTLVSHGASDPTKILNTLLRGQ